MYDYLPFIYHSTTNIVLPGGLCSITSNAATSEDTKVYNQIAPIWELFFII